MNNKYALILAFSYPKNYESNHNLKSLPSAYDDMIMMVNLSKKMGINPNNITIITDISVIKKQHEDILNCNIHMNSFPSDTFVCREIIQFIENTIRGIEDNLYKNNGENIEVFLYISGHGEKININDQYNQGIILTDIEGKFLKYLLAKDIFNIIFGNFYIDNDGRMEIPIYTKIKKYKKLEVDGKKMLIIESIGVEDKITVNLSPIVNSPENSPTDSKPYRSSYLTKRGIPPSTKMLIVIDTCYSEHMTYFPFTYEPRSQIMIPTSVFNFDIGIDLPKCVTISSCEFNKISKCENNGSSLTKILYMQLLNFNGRLNISQLHYLIYNSQNKIINKLLKNEATHPIITSTSNDSEVDIPFFDLIVNVEIEIIDK